MATRLARPLALAALAALGPLGALGACGGHGAPAGPDGPHAADAARAGDAAAGDAPVGDAPADAGSYRSSLGVCWTDATCPRVMALAHGGAWNLSDAPYDSNAAIAAAYADGDDGVKIDVRVTADNVPVVAHSSPIQIYESLDCSGQKIEDMTAAQVTACHRFPSSTETFQRLSDVLTYLSGKMVVQLTVKRAVDYERTIQLVHSLGAEDYAFFEISPTDLEQTFPTLAGADTVYDLIEVNSDLSQIDGVLALHDPRAFMIEIDPGVALGTVIQDKLHPANVRAFMYDSTATPTTSLLEGYYNAGFDAVSSQSGPVGVMARQAVNTARGVSPP